MKCNFVGCEGKPYAKWKVRVCNHLKKYEFFVFYCKQDHLVMMDACAKGQRSKGASANEWIEFIFLYILDPEIPWQPDILQYEEKPTDPVEA